MNAMTTPQLQRRRADRARQLADLLRRQIVLGRHDGRVLPSESELVAEFGATRNTVRAALELLRDEGLVDRWPGVGTVPTGAKVPHGLNRLQGLAETLDQHGEVVNEVRAAQVVAAPCDVAARLDLLPGDPVVYVERLRRLAGVPLSLDQTYLVRDLGEPLLEEDLASTDVFALLERHSGQPLGEAELAVEAVTGDPHTAALLQLPRHGALLMLERLTRLADGRPVDFEFIRFRGDRLTFHGTARREDR